MDGLFFIPCPNCDGVIEIMSNEINCGIFRHAVLKANGEQINPHSSKEECEKLIDGNNIYGCGKPFRIVKNGDEYQSVECDYI